MSARSSGEGAHGRWIDGSMDVLKLWGCWIHRPIERSTHCSIYRSTNPIRPHWPTMVVVVVGSWSGRGPFVVGQRRHRLATVGLRLALGSPPRSIPTVTRGLPAPTPLSSPRPLHRVIRLTIDRLTTRHSDSAWELGEQRRE